MNYFLWQNSIERKIDIVAKMVESLKSLIASLIEEGDKFDGFDANGELRDKAKQLGVDVKERG